VLIRCERCSTLYELEESLLSPEGSPVQCTRCEHVFTARPPRASELTVIEPLPGAPRADELALATAAASAPPVEPPQGSARGSNGSPPANSPAPRPEPVEVRAAAPVGPRAPASCVPSRPAGSGPAVYRPAPGQAPMSRPPVLRTNPVGAFESRLRWSARLRWLVPAVAAGVLGLALGGWFLLSRRGGSRADGPRAEALLLLALDDDASVDAAIAKLDDVLRAAPELGSAEADRALALVLKAAALRDDAQALAARAAERAGELDRLRRDQAPGWEAAEQAIAAQLAALQADGRAREESSRALDRVAAEALARVEKAGATLESGRAAANLEALQGLPEKLRTTASTWSAAGAEDPWLALATAAADARSDDAGARERGAATLAAVVERRPDILRARYLLARTQAALGKRAAAVATLDALLAANPRHERAAALRADLGRPAPAPPAPEAAPAIAAPGNGATLPRKPFSQSAASPVVSGIPAARPAQPAAFAREPHGAGIGVPVPDALPAAALEPRTSAIEALAPAAASERPGLVPSAENQPGGPGGGG
jgi:predicted Zn finger-like uncharacterized protein